jgi:hypothetical protein
VQEKFARLFAGEGVDEAALASIIKEPEQNEWVSSVLSQLGAMAAVFASMRWHFVQFREALLVTSDSPISMWRREELGEERGYGLQSVDEVRFPLAPTLALVMSWEPGEPRIIGGDEAMARELNMGTCEWATVHQRFFTCADPVPPLPRTDAENTHRAVAADLSVLPPMQAHQEKMRETFAIEVEGIPGLEDIAAELKEAGRWTDPSAGAEE